jgi:hypothetical protein
MDKMMVRYKGSYYLIRQYLPYIPTKWGLKVWSIENSCTKYGYKFAVSIRVAMKSIANLGKLGEACINHKVVTYLLKGFNKRGHAVYINNQFTSKKLLVDLVAKKKFSTCTTCTSSTSLPLAPTNKLN